MQKAGLETHSVGTSGAKKSMEMGVALYRCGSKEPVPTDVESSKKGPVKDCDICGVQCCLSELSNHSLAFRFSRAATFFSNSSSIPSGQFQPLLLLLRLEKEYGHRIHVLNSLFQFHRLSRFIKSFWNSPLERPRALAIFVVFCAK